jgi:mRNA-degrading endonuclease RelE of RelBE toxin-antitoxin system
MVKVEFDDNFVRNVSKIKDSSIKERLEKLFFKIKENPEIGKPMRFSRKGTREVYVGSFRLSYIYIKEQNLIKILELYHKDNQ